MLYVKTLSTLTAILFGYLTLSAQPLYTQDGIYIGEQEVLVNACIESADAETTKLNGLSFQSADYCNCVISTLAIAQL